MKAIIEENTTARNVEISGVLAGDKSGLAKETLVKDASSVRFASVGVATLSAAWAEDPKKSDITGIVAA